MSKNDRKSIEKCRKKLSQFTTMNVIDGQAGLIIYTSLIFYSLTIDNILNIIVLLILAGISVSSLTGNSGILIKAKEAGFKQEVSTIKEGLEMKKLEDAMNFSNPEKVNANLPIKNQIEGITQYTANCRDGVSLLQTTNGALSELDAILEHIKDLIGKYEEVYEEADALSIEREIKQLLAEIDKIASFTSISGIVLLNENKTLKIYYEASKYEEIVLEDFSTNGLDIKNLSFATTEEREEAKTKIENALKKVTDKQEYFKQQNEKLNAIISNLEKSVEELNKSEGIDDITLEEIKRNGELETEKIQQIETILSNLEQALGNCQSKEENLNEIHDKCQKINELATEASGNVTLNEGDLSIMQQEVEQLKQEINTLANNMGSLSTSYKISLDGDTIEIKVDNFHTSQLGENNQELYLDVTNPQNAEKTKKAIEKVIEKGSLNRAKLGSTQNMIEYLKSYYEDIKIVLNSRIEEEDTKNNRLAFAGLQAAQNCLSRIRVLSIKSEDCILASLDLEVLRTEMERLVEGINIIVNQTKNKEGVNLLNGTWKEDINVTSEALGINEIKNDTLENSKAYTEKVEKAIVKVFHLRKQISGKKETVSEFQIPEKWKNKLKVENGELVYIGTEIDERKWAEELKIKTN